MCSIPTELIVPEPKTFQFEKKVIRSLQIALHYGNHPAREWPGSQERRR
jgi:hypothetical protein